MKCGIWNQVKIWSSHLLDNLSNCLMNLKKSGDSTGFEPMTSAMPVQCSNQLNYEVTQLKVVKYRTSYHFSFTRHSFHGKTWAQQIDLLSIGFESVESPEFFRFMRQLLKLSSECEDHIFTWYLIYANLFIIFMLKLRCSIFGGSIPHFIVSLFSQLSNEV